MNIVKQDSGSCPLCGGVTEIVTRESFPFPEECNTYTTTKCAKCQYSLESGFISSSAQTIHDYMVHEQLEQREIVKKANQMLEVSDEDLLSMVNALTPEEAIKVWYELCAMPTTKWVTAGEMGQRNYESSVTPGMSGEARAAMADYYDNEVRSAPEPTEEYDAEKATAIDRAKQALLTRFHG